MDRSARPIRILLLFLSATIAWPASVPPTTPIPTAALARDESGPLSLAHTPAPFATARGQDDRRRPAEGRDAAMIDDAETADDEADADEPFGTPLASDLPALAAAPALIPALAVVAPPGATARPPSLGVLCRRRC